MRILVLALGVPFPPLGGGLTRTFHLLKSVADHHQVALAAFTYGEPSDRPPYPIQVAAAAWQWSADYREMIGADPEASRCAYERLAHHTDDPWFASVMDPGPMERALAALTTIPPDLVLLEGTPLARFLPSLPAGVPRILDLFDVHSAMVDPAADPREAQRTLMFERRAAQGCDCCLAVSDLDAAAAKTLLGAERVHVVPNGVDTEYFAPSTAPLDAGALLFTGRMNYGPNEDAVCFFADDVLPLVRRAMPHARFHIVGAAPSPRVQALASEAVIVHGRVEDVRPHLAAAEIVVVPIRAGGGTRLKVLEAAASGKAIATTRLGIEGLPLCDGHDVAVGDSAERLADAVVMLLRDRTRAQQLGARAREAVAPYEWSAIGESFRRIVEATAGG